MMRALVHALKEGGVQNTLGGARGDSKNPQGILHPRSKYTRVFGMGVPKTGGAKFPMTPVCLATAVRELVLQTVFFVVSGCV